MNWIFIVLIQIPSSPPPPPQPPMNCIMGFAKIANLHQVIKTIQCKYITYSGFILPPPTSMTFQQKQHDSHWYRTSMYILPSLNPIKQLINQTSAGWGFVADLHKVKIKLPHVQQMTANQNVNSIYVKLQLGRALTHKPANGKNKKMLTTTSEICRQYNGVFPCKMFF